jgi:hypothetical protein
MRHRGVGPARRRYPLHLEAKNYRDLTSIEPLIEDIRAGQGVELKPEFRETYITAPEAGRASQRGNQRWIQ